MLERGYNMEVSIIVPIYNAQKFLEETLRSIESQTATDFEVILVDDGSTDESGTICDRWAAKDKRFKVIHQQNTGVVKARNAGVSLATGRFIAFLDADDRWLPEKLQTQIDFMKKENIILSYSAYQFIDEEGKVLKKYFPHRKTVNYHQLLKSNCMGCLTVVYWAEKIGKHFFPEVQKGPEDFAFLLSLLKLPDVKEASCINEILAEYRVVKNSRSRNKFKAALGHWHILRKVERRTLICSIFLFFEYAYRAFLKNK